MSHAIEPIRATDPLIRAYYAGLKSYAEKGVTHEGATETAFSRLLNDTAAKHGWLLVPKQAVRVKGKTRPIYPDGTLRDVYNLPRGYWEAKDSDDNLEDEIRKKIEDQYPLVNTIFEDDVVAVLYHLDLQGGVRSNQELSGTAYNVFGIQVGVGITLRSYPKSLGFMQRCM